MPHDECPNCGKTAWGRSELKLNLDTDLAVRLRSLGAALAEHESGMKKLWIYGMSLAR